MIGILAALLLIAAGIIYAADYLKSDIPPPTGRAPQPAPPASEPPPKLPEPESEAPPEQPAPPEESKAPIEPQSLTMEQKIEKLRNAIAEVGATGESQEVTLLFTETEANAMAAVLLVQFEMPEDIPLQIENVNIDFQKENTVVTEAETALLTLKVTSHVSIEEGKPAVEVTDINLPLPQSLKDQIAVLVREKTVALLDQLTRSALDNNGEVELEYTDIAIQEEDLTITLLLKPAA